MQSPARRAWSLGLLAALAWLPQGCKSPERGLPAAERQLAEGDLTAALLELDSVVPADPDYSKARSLAAAVERRMRSAQRFLFDGLSLRAEWRDEEALAAFDSALEIWPGLVGVDELIQATRVRRTALGPREADAEGGDDVVAPGVVATTSPVDLPPGLAAPMGEIAVGLVDKTSDRVGGTSLPATEGAVPPTGSGESVEGAEAVVDPTPEGPAPAADGTQDPSVDRTIATGRSKRSAKQSELDPVIQQELEEIRDHLRRGGVDRALELLEELDTEQGGIPVVRGMLIQVMHQQALLHYGQGDLRVAVETWQRLLELQPDHDNAGAFLRAAQTELRSSR